MSIYVSDCVLMRGGYMYLLQATNSTISSIDKLDLMTLI